MTNPLLDPAIVLRFGPMVKATWSVSDLMLEQLERARRPAPKSVAGLLLIDTGASHTCIGIDVAEELQLQPTSIGRTYGAGGLHENPEFLASLSLRLPLAKGGHGTVTREQVALGVPDLNRPFERPEIRSTLPGGVTWRLIGLIGRDLLQDTIVKLDGLSGRFELTVHS